jgi:hypothetical protein
VRNERFASAWALKAVAMHSNARAIIQFAAVLTFIANAFITIASAIGAIADAFRKMAMRTY